MDFPFRLVMKVDLQDIAKISGGRYSVSNLTDAERFCRSIATSHYENFPVASVLFPKNRRQDIFNIYAFARTADDIADTLLDFSEHERRMLLSAYLENLHKYVSGSTISEKNNPVLLALSKTINRLGLPLDPFEKLIAAFSWDSDFKQPREWSDLHAYCAKSANPVGELVLRVFGLYNRETAYLSDCICTGLQLVNFWQDFSVDLPNGRVFIPSEILQKHNLSETDYNSWAADEKFQLCLEEIYDYTEKYFVIGKELVNLLFPKRLKIEISLTRLGGMKILEKTRQLGINILQQRPQISKCDIMQIFTKSLI